MPVLAAVGVLVYLLPSVVALSRRAPHRGTILMVNVLLGWTVVGWFYSLAAACSDRNGQSLGEVHLSSVSTLRPVSEPAKPADLPRAA